MKKAALITFCYILECADGSFYTGWTTDPQRRERQHNAGHGARYTRTRTPVRVVYIEEYTDRSSAMRRERRIKAMSRAEKEKLIKQTQERSNALLPAIEKSG
ncbi:MAG: GIY-YIG nuclease family protein [Chloroflexota bacterium]